MRECLIIVRAGDNSLHPNWLNSGKERTFDLLVSYYGSQSGRFREHADLYHEAPGPRWPAHDAICENQWELLRRYEYVAFACDDLDTSSATWDRLFAICRRYRLDLAQPAIDGPVSHGITAPQDGSLFRYTNFVEVMCPVFRSAALDKVRGTFKEAVSGWGLDFLWSKLLPYPEYKLAIIDGAVFKHTCPPGEGSLRQVLQDQGITKEQEMARLMAKHGIRSLATRNIACIPAPAPAKGAVTELYNSLTEEQRQEVCFEWDHEDATRGVVRTFLTNHWQVTRPCIRSEFFSADQQQLIHDIFKGLFKPEWYPRMVKQLQDDTKGHPWGANQSIGIFGTPGFGPCQIIFTGRHLTLRADAYANPGAAFGGPILYGHAAGGFYEKPGHPGNIFWRQAQAASRVYDMLGGRQRQMAIVPRLPPEAAIGFKGPQGKLPGIPVQELTRDQQGVLQKVLEVLLEPFRSRERWLTLGCLSQFGGLGRCSLAFYQENQMSGDTWDSWRLEGPAFVWYFRGVPHVHVWVHVSRDYAAPVNGTTGTYIHPHHDPLL